jgi:hypothetical protein
LIQLGRLQVVGDADVGTDSEIDQNMDIWSGNTDTGNACPRYPKPPQAGGTLYFLEGQEVSKEEFVLKSDMDHLLDDPSTVRCSRCWRESTPKNYRTRCGMPQPSGQTCDGVFY